jgi:quercetin dioxygenase-like cupin family protein
MKSKSLWAVLVVLLGVGVYAGTVLATPPSGLTTSTVAKSSFDSLSVKAHSIPANIWRAKMKTHGLSDFYVIDNHIAPGGTTGWHSHPGPSLIFVVAGTVTNYIGDDPQCAPHEYSAGQGFVDEGGDDVHMLRNEGSVTAETVAVQFLPAGATRRIDKDDPGNCNF